MNNADKFKQIFNLYATELWAMSEKDFLAWLNAERGWMGEKRMDNVMQFPKTWEEFEANYGFNDREEIYTNGVRLIPSFRVEQWLEHIDMKHGKWIAAKYCDETVRTECSVCGYSRGLPPVRNYCPNCGAKMEIE